MDGVAGIGVVRDKGPVPIQAAGVCFLFFLQSGSQLSSTRESQVGAVSSFSPWPPFSLPLLRMVRLDGRGRSSELGTPVTSFSLLKHGSPGPLPWPGSLRGELRLAPLYASKQRPLSFAGWCLFLIQQFWTLVQKLTETDLRPLFRSRKLLWVQLSSLDSTLCVGLKPC